MARGLSESNPVALAAFAVAVANAQVTWTYPALLFASKTGYTCPSPATQPHQVDTGTGLIRGVRAGYNIYNSTTENQDSLYQTSFTNGVDDFSLWAAIKPDSEVLTYMQLPEAPGPITTMPYTRMPPTASNNTSSAFYTGLPRCGVGNAQGGVVEVESVLGSIAGEQFAQLLDLSKKVTDYNADEEVMAEEGLVTGSEGHDKGRKAEKDIVSPHSIDTPIVPRLNRVQTKLYAIAFGTDEPRSTNVAILMILSELAKWQNEETGKFDFDGFKIAYIAPMKALLQEMVGNFQARLKVFGIKIIVTTPEKWDVITRKSTDASYTNLIRLIIINKVHLLHNDRGPVLEAMAHTI
ncbi:Activating signal cointegrator 1 complex subunit 3-like protein [Leucoagaricus sp. SymC.cos]|nr:Activating signal cointegrator 1 complex subunit 3-like protein [Leucoagaricus sp. SymC.cos]